VEDDCTCSDCANDGYCGNAGNCVNDGKCEVYLEGCVCADCEDLDVCKQKGPVKFPVTPA
jgi:hypothetical protein